jgi:DNA mismatch endonuclease, patch repair protein
MGDSNIQSWASTTAVRKLMQANRRSGTKPEVQLRSMLHRHGMRFRKDYPVQLPGRRKFSIDIAFTRARVAVLVDGCFWHGCDLHKKLPTTNSSYWTPKINGNKMRDAQVEAALSAAGWRVVRVWEHESPQGAMEAVVSGLHSLNNT